MFRDYERTALNALAFLGALVVFLGLILDSLALRDAGSVCIGIAVILWGAAHLTGREWAHQTSFGGRRIWPVVFIILGILILLVVVGDRLVD